jgi:ribosome biogenesis GTPase
LNPLLDLRVGEISNKHDKGIHTTTFAEMIILNNDTYIIDTPGIKEFGIMNFELEEIGQYFREFKAVMNDCQFNNCLHLEEPNCAVKNAMEQGKIHPERYFNYVSILEGYKENFNYWERKS